MFLILFIGLTIYTFYKCVLFYLNNFVYKMANRAEEVDGINKKIAIVTGCNEGMGLETAFELADRGAPVILANLNNEFSRQAEIEIRKRTQNGKLIKKQIDLGHTESIRKFCIDISGQYEKIDILINNAGVYTFKKLRSKDNYEIHWAVNYLGPFLLTNLLLPLLKKSNDGRVVNVGSTAFKTGEIDFNDLMKDKINEDRPTTNFLYANSKLALAHFTREFSRKTANSNSVKSYFLCPGGVKTNIIKDDNLSMTVYFVLQTIKLFSKTPNQGCQTALYCALSKHTKNETGKLYKECEEWNPDKVYPILDLHIKNKLPVLEEKISKKLWEVTEYVVGLK